jgi:hypothetical protein
MEKVLSDYIHDYGYIGHKWENGPIALEYGDGTQRIFMYGLLKNSLFIPNLYFVDGEPVRHPNSIYWWGQPGTMSADNYIPPLCYYICFYNRRGSFTKVLWPLIKRLGFTWNRKHIWPEQNPGNKMPDWMGPVLPMFILHWINFPLLRPLTELADLPHLIQAVSLWYMSIKKPYEVSDHLNFRVIQEFCRRRQRTYVSRFAWWFYQKFTRPVVHESVTSKDPCKAAFQYYFRHNSAPPLDKVLWAYL